MSATHTSSLRMLNEHEVVDQLRALRAKQPV
jgi:hypothetical protein